MDQPWGTILPGLADPVVGEPSDYETAKQAAQTLHDSSQACADEFSNIKAGDSEICGSTADKLVDVIKQVDSTFQELPGIFHSLSMIFGDHETKLQALRQKAVEALARANTHWTDLKTAETRHETAATRLRNVGNRRDEAASAPPTDLNAAARLRELDRQHDRAYGELQSARRQIEAQKAALDGSRTEHAGLVTSEAELVTQTCTKLRNLDLGCLEDPGRLVQLFNDVVDWAHDLGDKMVDALVDLLKILQDGFLDALWYLSKALDTAVKILAVAALVFAFIGIFCPPALAISGELAEAAMILSTTKVVVDAILALTEHPDPETGKTMKWKDVIIEGIITAVSYGVGSVFKALGAETEVIANQAILEIDDLGLVAKALWNSYRVPTKVPLKTIEIFVGDGISEGIDFASDHVDTIMRGAVRTAVAVNTVGQLGKYAVPKIIEAVRPHPLPELLDKAWDQIKDNWSSVIKFQAFGPVSDASVAAYQLVGVS